jgi:hypothetical protein
VQILNFIFCCNLVQYQILHTSTYARWIPVLAESNQSSDNFLGAIHHLFSFFVHFLLRATGTILRRAKHELFPLLPLASMPSTQQAMVKLPAAQTHKPTTAAASRFCFVCDQQPQPPSQQHIHTQGAQGLTNHIAANKF